VTLATGPACLECTRVGVGEVSRACVGGWPGDCHSGHFRLDRAGVGGVGVAGGGGGGGGKVAAWVSSLSFSNVVCSSWRKLAFRTAKTVALLNNMVPVSNLRVNFLDDE
jgi:hypothetical protein